MLHLLTVPDLGTVEREVRLAKWLAREGAEFRRGEPLAVVETLKAAFEVEAERDGVLVRIAAREGTRVAVH